MTTRRSIALILSPVGLLFISTARLIIVSDFNTTTAVTIASSGGYINTLLGSVIPLIPIFIPYLALLLLLFRRFLLSVLAFVFAAYITPTPISLTDAVALVKADWQQLIVQVSGLRLIAVLLVLLVLLVVWGYQRSFAEGVSAVVAMALGIALLLAVPSGRLARPLRLASTNEHRLVAHLLSGPYLNGLHVWLLLFLMLFLLILWSIGAFKNLPVIFAWLLSTAIAVVATVAFLPYAYDLYPIPRHSSFYATVAHTMWLPTEKLVLSSGKIDYGYVLSSSSGWFTVLSEPSRTIAYLPVADVLARSVCQPKGGNKPLRYPQYPPLITTLYTPPPRIAPCTGHIRSTVIRAVRSQGEPLTTIASMVNVPAGRIISITNAYQHERHEQLSHALHHYEKVHDWNAPTPVGQRFWYYPLQTP